MNLSIRKAVGFGLIASPFIAIFVSTAWAGGILFALSAFAGAAVVIGVLCLGIALVVP